MVTRIDWMVVGLAAGAGLVLIVPGAALSALVADRTGDWAVWPFLALVLAGFGVSGAVAGGIRSDTPMVHGALGAAAAFAVALAVGLVAAVLRGRSISLAVVPLTLLLAVTAGVGGSLLVDLVHRRRLRRRGGTGPPSERVTG